MSASGGGPAPAGRSAADTSSLDGHDWTRLPARLRDRGLRWTPQRRMLIEVLARTDGHVTGAELVERCRELDPETTPSTVYRTLDVLEQLGVVRHGHRADGREEFHVRPVVDHGHLYGGRCGGSWEIGADEAASFVRAIERRRGFAVDLSHLTVVGACRSCGSAATGQPEGGRAERGAGRSPVRACRSGRPIPRRDAPSPDDQEEASRSMSHTRSTHRPVRIEPGPGQESVWDYPRPPRVEDVPDRLRVLVGGVVAADTTRGRRVLETAGAPVYYFPPEDVRLDLLSPSETVTVCEWKGLATYHTLRLDGLTIEDVAWSYGAPRPGFEGIAGYLAFYGGKVDEAWVGPERATPQPGGFYGGWVTSRVVGPFKGEPGTSGW